MSDDESFDSLTEPENDNVFDDEVSDNEDPEDPEKFITKIDRRGETTGMITIYEWATLMGRREHLLQQGANPTINLDEINIDSLFTIAVYELRARKLPLILERSLPNGEIELWDPNNMKLPRIALS